MIVFQPVKNVETLLSPWVEGWIWPAGQFAIHWSKYWNACLFETQKRFQDSKLFPLPPHLQHSATTALNLDNEILTILTYLHSKIYAVSFLVIFLSHADERQADFAYGVIWKISLTPQWAKGPLYVSHPPCVLLHIPVSDNGSSQSPIRASPSQYFQTAKGKIIWILKCSLENWTLILHFTPWFLL